VNLVRASEADAFAQKLLEGYLASTGIAAELYHCHAAAGAHPA
jgi:galactokinase